MVIEKEYLRSVHNIPYFTKIELHLIAISKILGAFKISEHDCSPNFSTANILNAQIKKTRAFTAYANGVDRNRECGSWLPRLPVYLNSDHWRNAGL